MRRGLTATSSFTSFTTSVTASSSSSRKGMRASRMRAAGRRPVAARASTETPAPKRGVDVIDLKNPNPPMGPVPTGPPGVWLPGAARPAHLDGATHVGDYGFDPLNLGATDAATFSRLQEAELIHARWCMLAAPGIIIPEALGYGDWLQPPIDGMKGAATYAGVSNPLSIGAHTAITFFVMGAVEIFRSEERDPERRKYPGGTFDPLGFTNDPTRARIMKSKELANGRLAMWAVLGIFCQTKATGAGPWAVSSGENVQAARCSARSGVGGLTPHCPKNLITHIGDPWHINVATNGYASSLPLPRTRPRLVRLADA